MRNDKDLIELLFRNPLLTEEEARRELGLPPIPDTSDDLPRDEEEFVYLPRPKTKGIARCGPIRFVT